MSRSVVAAACCGWLLVAAHAQESDDPVAALVVQLAGKDPKAQRRAAKELGRRGGEQSIRALSRALGDASGSVRHEAAIALARLAPDKPEVVGVLIESLKSEDWYVRWQACLALRALGPRGADAVPALIEVLCDAKGDIGREAALALGAVAPNKREVVDALVGVLEDQRPPDRRAVFFALRRARRTALAHLIPWLAREVHGNEHGCSEPAQRLLEVVAIDHAGCFLNLFAPEEWRRVQAPGWIAGPKREHYRYPRWELSVPALAAALKDDSRRVRCRVLEALGKLGTHAKGLLPDIVRSTVATFSSERYAARHALRALAPSLTDVTKVYPEGNNVWKVRFVRVTPKGARALLILLTDPALGEGTLSALAQTMGRTNEDVLKELRAEAAKK